jgi:tetratricopeptide (TPR) repeat protein
MTESFAFKPISKPGIPRALEKAERYRLLNDPEGAESICMDILAVEPDHQEALVVLILALTDQLARQSATQLMERAREHLARLTDPYERTYYEGLIYERQARGYLERGPSRVFAYDGLRDAMEVYEKASAIRPEGNDDAILRWNACVRTIQSSNLRPAPDYGGEQPLE